jgi:hypothetical protein
MSRFRRPVVFLMLGVAGALMVLAGTSPPATAWYGPFVFTSPASAKPGEEVMAQGYYWAKTDPVQARLDAVDGKVLASFTPQSGSKGMEFHGPVQIPADTRAGVHVLVFTQFDGAGKIVQMPPRAVVSVTDAGGALPAVGAPLATDQSARPEAVERAGEDPLGFGELALIAAGAAGVAMFVVGIASLLAARPSTNTATAVTQ